MKFLSWLEDFNEYAPEPEPAEPEIQEELPPDPDPRQEGWTEGFIAGWNQAMESARPEASPATIELIHRIEQLETQLRDIAALSAAQMGELVIDMLARAVPPDWPQPVAERLGKVIEAVRPAFWLDPKLHLHGEVPGELGFHDLPGFARAIEQMQESAWPVTIQWDTQANPEQMTEALREALS